MNASVTITRENISMEVIPNVTIPQTAITNLVSDLALKLESSSYTAANVLAKLLTVDGSGSGLDADLLDGQSSTYYLNYSNLTNTPSVFASATVSSSAVISQTALHANTASSIAGSLVTGTVASATVATHAGTASSIAGSLVSGTVASATVSSSATVATHAGTASSIAGSLVSGTVASATVSSSATVATHARTASSIAGSLVTGAVASATISSSATIADSVKINSVALGTDTTGNYVSNISGGSGISITGTAGEGWIPTVAIDFSTNNVWTGTNKFNNAASFSGGIVGMASGSAQISMTSGSGSLVVSVPSTIVQGAGMGIKTNVVVTERTSTSPRIVTSVAVASDASTFTIYATDVVGTTSSAKTFAYIIHQQL
jgi:hypothetical protein